MNVMGVGAHYDDLELGCGGTLMKHVQKGDKVTMVTITDSSYKNAKGEQVRDDGLPLTQSFPHIDGLCVDHVPKDYI